MGRLVAALAHGVEDVGHLARQDLLGREPPKQIVRRLTGSGIIDTGERGDLLDHVFAELTALDQRGIGVICKEAFSKRAQTL